MVEPSRIPSELWAFGKQVVSEFVEDDCLSMAAALAYYTVFSLAPLVVAVLLLAGLVIPPEQANEAFYAQLKQLLGPTSSEQVAVMVNAVRSGHAHGLFGRIVGTAVTVFGATGVMVQLQSALNRAWQVVPDPGTGGVRNFLFKRLLSFAMILGIAFLLLVSLVLTAVLNAIAQQAQDLLPVKIVSLQLVNFAVSLVVITALFATIYKVMPDARIRWRDVAVGAVISALLFTVGKLLIGLYLGNSNIGTAYGAASSLAVLLVWVYYSSVTVLLGAEFTQVWTRRYGRGLEPQRGATIAGRTAGAK